MAPKVEVFIDGVWVDLTAGGYVMYDEKIRLSRGTSELSLEASAATAKFCLRNTDYRFSTDSPYALYYRKFRKGALVRVSCTEDTNPVRFFGAITKLRPTRDLSGTDLRVYVECASYYRRVLSHSLPLKSAMYRAIERSTPYAWWPLETGDERATDTIPNAGVSVVPLELVASPATTGSSEEHRLSGVVAGSVVGPIGASGAIDMSGGGQLAAYIDRATRVRGQNIAFAVQTTTSWSVEISFMFTNPVDIAGDPGDTGQILRVNFGTDSFIGFFAGDTPSAFSVEVGDDITFDSIPFTNVVDDGVWHHLSLLMVSGGGTSISYNVRLDGEVILSDTSATLMGQPRQIVVSPSGELSAAAHLVLYRGDDIPLDPTYLYRAFIGNAGETTPDRLDRLFGEQGYAFDYTSSAEVVDEITLGAQLPEELSKAVQKALDVGKGFLYNERDSNAFFYRAFKDTTNGYPRLRLDWSLNEPFGNIVPTDDDIDLANDIVATRDNGGEPQQFTIEDEDGFWHWTTEEPEDSNNGVGTQSAAVSVNTETDDLAWHMAGWEAHIRSWREARYPSVSVHFQRSQLSSAQKLAAASMVLGDRIEITNIPRDLPSGPILMMVQGEEEVIDQFERVIEWNCVPALTREVEVVETCGSLLANAIDNDDTSLRVATSLGKEWSTSDVPYYIQINGDVMKVTAVTTDTPTFIATGAAAHGNNASVSPGLPAGMTADSGQLMLLFAAIRNSGTGTVNTPSGWNVLKSFGNMSVFWKYRVTGDSAPTVSFTGGVANADTSAIIAGWTNLSPYIATYPKSAPDAATQLNGSAQDILYPAFQLATGRTGVSIIFTWKQDDNTAAGTPSGFTAMFNQSTTTGDDQAITGRYDLTGVSELAGTVTQTGGASAISRAIVFHLRPLQTMTVTRNVNSSAVSHAIGDGIHAWRMGLNGL